MSTPTPDPVHLPFPFSTIPRHPLLFPTPSPIHPLPRISAALSATSPHPNPTLRIYAKREDHNSPLATGGNKVRKLEYLVADALAKGCTTLVSVGGVQSNHTRAVAAAAAATGLKAALVQQKWVDWRGDGEGEREAYGRVGNIQLSRLMGADVRLDGGGFGIEHKSALKELTEELEVKGEKVYYIPAGASDHPLGGLGFARWAFEVAAQEQEMGLFFDTIVVCAVTGSTFAGMIAGFKYLSLHPPSSSSSSSSTPPQRHRRILGIDASAAPSATRAQVLRIARSTAEAIGLPADSITEDDIELDERFHEGCYGIPGEATKEAIRFGASTEGFVTDPVYEGKSLAGLMAMVGMGEVGGGSCVLYAHLGGQNALNAYASL